MITAYITLFTIRLILSISKNTEKLRKIMITIDFFKTNSSNMSHFEFFSFENFIVGIFNTVHEIFQENYIDDKANDFDQVFPDQTILKL